MIAQELNYLIYIKVIRFGAPLNDPDAKKLKITKTCLFYYLIKTLVRSMWCISHKKWMYCKILYVFLAFFFCKRVRQIKYSRIIMFHETVFLNVSQKHCFLKVIKVIVSSYSILLIYSLLITVGDVGAMAVHVYLFKIYALHLNSLAV